MSSGKIVLAIDAGGTFLKSALVDTGAGIVGNTLFSHPSNSDSDIALVREAYKNTVKTQLENAVKNHLKIDAVCVDTPGPFDFEKGASLMKHKYRAIYGISVIPWIQEEAGGLPIKFLHDSTAFILGEKTMLPEYNNIAGVMIGTGLGFALMRKNRVLLNESNGPLISIFKTPYYGKTAEDYLSGRGIVREYNALSVKPLRDAKEIACRAEAGDSVAMNVYEKLGIVLTETIHSVLAEQKTEALIIGGQIARSFNLFSKALSDGLNHLSDLRIVRASQLIETGHLLGAAGFHTNVDCTAKKQISDI